jgi:hypothetical protein
VKLSTAFGAEAEPFSTTSNQTNVQTTSITQDMRNQFENALALMSTETREDHPHPREIGADQEPRTPFTRLPMGFLGVSKVGD